MKSITLRSALRGLAVLLFALFAHADPSYATSGAVLVGMAGEIADLADTEVQETFKEVYTRMVDAIPDATKLTAQLKRTTKVSVNGEGEVIGLAKLQTGGSIANVTDAGLLPRFAAPSNKKFKTKLVHTYRTIGVGGQAIALTKDRKGAFVSQLEYQMDDALLSSKLDVERQYNGDGRGILAVLETVVSAPVYGAHRAYGLTNGGPGTMNLVEDADVAVVNPADGVERGRATIASVDVDAETVTLSVSVAGAAIGDFLVLCNDVGAAAADKENNYNREAPGGVVALCKSGDTFQEISGVTYRRWNATVLKNAGVARPISEMLLGKLDRTVRTKSGREPGTYDCIHYTTPGIALNLISQLAGLRRYNGETTTVKGGYGALKILGKAVLEGDFAAKGRWFVINTSDECAGMLDAVKMGFIDLDGAKLHRIEGRHAYRADLWFPHGAIWPVRNAHGVIEDLEDDESIVR